MGEFFARFRLNDSDMSNFYFTNLCEIHFNDVTKKKYHLQICEIKDKKVMDDSTMESVVIKNENLDLKKQIKALNEQIDELNKHMNDLKQVIKNIS